jgi:hypothetical protein
LAVAAASGPAAELGVSGVPIIAAVAAATVLIIFIAASTPTAYLIIAVAAVRAHIKMLLIIYFNVHVAPAGHLIAVTAA